MLYLCKNKNKFMAFFVSHLVNQGLSHKCWLDEFAALFSSVVVKAVNTDAMHFGLAHR